MKLLSIDEALDLVLRRAAWLPPRVVACQGALGLLLAEDVTADADSPPFDKAVVDGFAVRSGDLAKGYARLPVIGEITAGAVFPHALAAGEAAAIMTGASVPAGADTVVMVEETRREGAHVVISGMSPPGQNIVARGRETRAGEVVLASGSMLTPARLGVLASVGRCVVRVQPAPRVAIVATGDELVESDQPPGPGQIRNSNAPMLRALTIASGAEAEVLPIARDDPGELHTILGQGLAADVLLVSGGVSAGTRDLVPAALMALGVTNVFHRVNIKPGKPLWFGVGPARGPDQPASLVFGLPGNPVSGLVAFLVFVRPALARLAGRTERPRIRHGRLTQPFSHSGTRPSYIAAHWTGVSGEPGSITVLASAGSGDLRAAAQGNGFAMFAAGQRLYAEAEIVPFLPMD